MKKIHINDTTLYLYKYKEHYRQKYRYEWNGTVILFGSNNDILFFVKSTCKNPDDDINFIEKYCEEHLMKPLINPCIGIDPNIECDLDNVLRKMNYIYCNVTCESIILMKKCLDENLMGFSYVNYDIAKYMRNRKFAPKICRDDMIFLKKRVLNDVYEIAGELIPASCGLKIKEIAEGHANEKFISFPPKKYCFHTHPKAFHDAPFYVAFASFSTTDCKYILNHCDIIDSHYLITYEGIYDININPPYKNRIDPQYSSKILQKLNCINSIRQDDERVITENNVHKLRKLFKIFSEIDGKSVGIYCNNNETPIFNVNLNSWEELGIS